MTFSVGATLQLVQICLPCPNCCPADHSSECGPAPPPCLLQFYAPQAFATRITSWYTPEGNSGWLGRQLLWLGFHASSLWGAAKQSAIVGLLFAVAGADWPIQQLTGGG